MDSTLKYNFLKHVEVAEISLRSQLPLIVMRSNIRWCSNGFEFTCWNREVIRVAFIIGTDDLEIIASDIRDMMLETVEKRFTALRAPETIEMLTDSGSA